MCAFLTFVLFLFLFSAIHSQEPRKRFFVDAPDYQKDDEITCTSKTCLKRSPEELGPFWANRGKKDPFYKQDKFYVDEPHWILIRSSKNAVENEPFFTSRGKKPLYWNTLKYSYDDNVKSRRDRRYFTSEPEFDPEFFAARGKKMTD